MSKASPSNLTRDKMMKNKFSNNINLVFLNCKNTNNTCIASLNLTLLLPDFVFFPIITHNQPQQGANVE